MVFDGNCTGNPYWEKIKCKKKNIGTIEDAEQLVTAMSNENNFDFSITSAPTLDGIKRANFETIEITIKIDDVKNETTEAVEENRWSEYSIEDVYAWRH